MKHGNDIREEKLCEIITIHKRIMRFCKSILEANERTSAILLDSSGKTKALAFAFLVHERADIPNRRKL